MVLYKKSQINFMYACDGALLILRVTFDDDNNSLRSTSLYLFTQYLRDDKSNALSIFMLSGSIQFSLPFQFNTNHASFINIAFEHF